MFTSVCCGIVFIEGNHPDAIPIKNIEISINGPFTQAQLKSLDDVKAKMAKIAQNLGANSITNFKYGQKSSFLDSIFSLDDVAWYGSGIASQLDNSTYLQIVTGK